MNELIQQVDTHKYEFVFDELGILPAVVEDYIGFTPGDAPEPFPELISNMLQEARDKIHLRGGYVLFPHPVIDLVQKRVILQSTVFLTQAIVTRHLHGSSVIALFACTAGSEITNWAAECNRKSNSIHAYLVDSLGSISVERAMDIIQRKLAETVSESGLHITNRYSPGYCGWALPEQRKLFDLLPEGFCGITLTDSMLMKPIKSVSGMIGLGQSVQYEHYTCNFCKDTHCLYRNKR